MSAMSDREREVLRLRFAEDRYERRPDYQRGLRNYGVGCATALARAGCSGGVVRGPFPGEIVRHAELNSSTYSRVSTPNACAIAA